MKFFIKKQDQKSKGRLQGKKTIVCGPAKKGMWTPSFFWEATDPCFVRLWCQRRVGLQN